jgi:hypothetical protein
MMQVYSLATWEVKKDKRSSGWFVYQNQSVCHWSCALKIDWHSLEDEDADDRSKSPQSNASTPDSPSASPLGVSLPPNVQRDTSRTFSFSDMTHCSDCVEQIQIMAQSESLKSR